MNLGTRGRRLRGGLGAGLLALSVVAWGGLVGLGAPREARLVLFVPLWIGGLGLFQALAGT